MHCFIFELDFTLYKMEKNVLDAFEMWFYQEFWSNKKYIKS